MESKRLRLYPRKRIDKGLADTGFIEGQTVKIEYRWANGDYDKCAFQNCQATTQAQCHIAFLVLAARARAKRSARSGCACQ